MIKLFILAIIFVIFCIIKLFLALIGMLSVGMNKRSTLIKFAYQYIKNAKKSSIILYPYIPQLVDNILVISKRNNFGIVEETDFLQYLLTRFVMGIDVLEVAFLYTRIQSNNKEIISLADSLYISFCEKYNIT